jgi:hypothetical protein
MRILYRFSDNDFYTTFIEVFEVIRRTIDTPGHNPSRLADKQYICDMINELAYPIYRVAQCRDFPAIKEPRFASEAEQREFYTKYFHATPDRIYLDKEIDILISENGVNSNCEWFILDMTIHDRHSRVYCI